MQTPGTLKPHWIRFAPYGLAFFPFLAAILLVVRYQVDIPFSDEWSFTWTLQKFYSRPLSFWALRDLLSAHAEHRIFFPRIILLPLIHFTGWNTTYQRAVNIVLAICLLTALSCQISRTLRLTGNSRPLWFVPMISLCVFSLHQWEVWLIGCVLMHILCALSGCLSLFFLAQPGFKHSNFLAGFLGAWVASFSHASGLVCWPVGQLILWGNSFPDSQTRRRILFLWFLVGFALLGASVILYKKPLQSPPPGFLLHHPLQFLEYVCSYLGAPLLFFQAKHAWLGGLAGVGLWVAASGLLIRSRLWEWKTLLPYTGLALYAVGTGFLTGIGRAAFGSAHAVSSRYIVYSQFLWISLLALLYFLIVGNHAGRTRSIGISTVSILIILLIGTSSFYGVLYAARWHEDLLPARAALVSGKDLELLDRVYLNPERREKTIAFLREHRLSVFRDTS